MLTYLAIFAAVAVLAFFALLGLGVVAWIFNWVMGLVLPAASEAEIAEALAEADAALAMPRRPERPVA